MVKEEYLSEGDVDFTFLSPDPRFQDLTGEIFGNIEILGPYKKEGKTLKWVAKCSCGNIVKTSRTKLKQRGKTSCVECAEADLRVKHFTPMEDKVSDLKKARPELEVLNWLGETWADEWEVKCTKCNDTFKRRYRDILAGVKPCDCGHYSRKKLEDKIETVENYCAQYGFTFEGWDVENRIKLKIYCPKHETDATPHFSNIEKGKICCKGCKKEHRKPYNLMSQEDFIKRSIGVHGEGKFDYSQVNYINSGVKVKIKCNNCQETNDQTPSGHLSGRGCKVCSTTGYKPNEPCWVYVMELIGLGDVWYKVGITKDLKRRLYNVSLNSWYDISYLDFKYLDKGYKARRIEQEVLSHLDTKGTIDERYHKEGYTEVFQEGELSIALEVLEDSFLDEIY